MFASDRPAGSEEPAAVVFAYRRTGKESIRPDIWKSMRGSCRPMATRV